MGYLLLLVALTVLPMLAILFLRVNGAIAFMSLCLGSVLAAYTGSDVTDIATSFTAQGTLNIHEWVQLVLLVLPFLLTILFTRKSVSGPKRVTNVLPAVASGMLFALLVVPLLPANIQRQIHELWLWDQLSFLQTSVILGGALFSLLFLLLTHRYKGEEEHKKKHKH